MSQAVDHPDDANTGTNEIGARIGPLLLLSALLGVGGALVASLFIFVEDVLQRAIWTDLPQRLGISTQQAWWYAALVLLAGAGVVLLARRLPGATGASPIGGFHFDTGPGTIASVALAALGTLVFGYVLGPEAPLIACGTALGGWVMRGRDAKAVQLGMLLGGVAAIGAIFGNPLITAFMILEFAAMGAMPAAALMPVLVALGAGYIVQVGLGPWSGLGTHSLAVTGLPAFTGLTGFELIGAVITGVIASIVALIARELGERVDVRAKTRPTATILVAWAVTAIVAIAAVAITGLGFEAVLFSGQEAIPTMLGVTSASAVLVIVIAKMLAYAVALGGGFRGGPIFPAVFLGVCVGVMVALVVPSFTVPGMVVAGIAATVAAMTRLAFTATLLAVLLASTAGAAITPLAIIGAIVGFLARTALDRADAKRTEAAAASAN